VTSERQIAANRRNGAKSRGPKTAEGKAAASRNALRHGLSRRISKTAGPAAAEVTEFAHLLVGEDRPQREIALAIAAAQAHFDLARIRGQQQLMVENLCGEAVPSRQTIERLERIGRYLRRAESRQRNALRRLSMLRRLPLFK
jgi:hypothetical protein